MASKLSRYPEILSLADNDLLPVLKDDGDGTYSNKRIKVSNVIIGSGTGVVLNGFVNRTSSSIAMNGSNFEITPVSSYDIYSNNTKFTKTTVQAVAITSDNTLSYIYFNISGILCVSTSMWDILSDNILVAIVHKSGANYIVNDERHLAECNRPLHQELHNTFGAMYKEGFTGTFDDTSLSVLEGTIFDEDIELSITPTQTTCRMMYRISAGTSMMFDGIPSDTPYRLDGTVLQYDNAGTLTNITNNHWCVNWIYASAATSAPIVCVLGQADYSTLNSALSSVSPVIPLDVAEWKLLYRVIYKNDSGTPLFVQADDYRNIITGPININPSTQLHAVNSLTNSNGFSHILSPSDTTVQAALQTIDNHSFNEGTNWHIIITDTLSVSNNGYLIDASSNTIILTLPVSPALNDMIFIRILNVDNSITIARNGSKIESVASDINIDAAGSAITLVYSNSDYGWVITSFK
jgi:hypothetical protein